MKHFSTGQAAKMLSVTPDAILKWIKQGRICAMRTPGGHYRVPEDQIMAILDQAGEADSAGVTELVEGSPPYCWEFFSDRDRPKPGCRDCLVYQARALKCYKMSHLCAEAGQTAGGRNSCDECDYFLAQLER